MGNVPGSSVRLDCAGRSWISAIYEFSEICGAPWVLRKFLSLTVRPFVCEIFVETVYIIRRRAKDANLAFTTAPCARQTIKDPIHTSHIARSRPRSTPSDSGRIHDEYPAYRNHTPQQNDQSGDVDPVTPWARICGLRRTS